MKRFVLVIMVLSMATAISGCSGCVAVPEAGHEAVLVMHPVIFGHGGVASDPIKTGLTFIAPTTSAKYVSMQPQQFAVHFEDLMSSDGVPLDFDSVIRLQVTDSVKLVRDFGDEWYKTNIEAEFTSRVRQAVRKHGMNETAISTVAIDAIDAEVSGEMEKYLTSANLPLKLVQVTVGKANPPDSIKNQRVETAAQQQRQLTEQQRKLAEDQRKEAEKSRAAADNVYREDMKLSPDQYLQLETIKMQHDACKAGNCTFIMGGGVTPVLNVK